VETRDESEEESSENGEEISESVGDGVLDENTTLVDAKCTRFCVMIERTRGGKSGRSWF